MKSSAPFRHRPSGWCRACPASRFRCAASPARWLHAFPIPPASSSRGPRAWRSQRISSSSYHWTKHNHLAAFGNPERNQLAKEIVQIRTDKYELTINIAHFVISAIYKFAQTGNLLAEKLLRLGEIKPGQRSGTKRQTDYADRLKPHQRSKEPERRFMRWFVDFSRGRSGCPSNLDFETGGGELTPGHDQRSNPASLGFLAGTRRGSVVAAWND